MNDADLELLTDEERAGLEADDGDDGDDSGFEGDDDGGDDDGNGDEGGDDGDNGDDDGANGNDDDGAAAGNDDAGAGAGAGNDDDDDDDTSQPPRSSGERIDATATQTRLDEIEVEQSELAEKLDDGEITTKEFLEANKALTSESSKLSGQLEQQAADDKAVTDRWYADVGKFLERNPELNANQTRLQSFDTVVRRVTGDPQNASLSNRKQLEKAHALWQEEMGIKPTGKGDPTPTPRRKAPRAELPPTLHNTPAADMNDTDDGRFSHLDGLLNAGKSIEFEEALGRLSEADQQDYLNRA
ncbi:MAG: hypothetical protein VYD90_10625 [Pseudomonadota bacterium]|nr:hypothetical protein [Pseudomonadota bacterium]